MRTLLLTVLLIGLAGSVALAADLPAADAALIEGAGVPLYPGATFATGSKDVGFRFATSEAPAVVRKWYQEKLAGWVLFDKYDSWILYQGEPGASMGDLMSLNQVQVQTNENLPEWHDVDKSMTTEIVIMVVQ
ncbi:MAG: hypothetical protein LJF30_07685 [Acidobacteria bacterium]|jgi:hypothetical protein|nr:hypothetical protein [Acidobacteriota bacterium]